MNNIIQQEADRLKELLSNLDDDSIKLLSQGIRPNSITFNDFKVFRKSFKEHINKYMKGKQIYATHIPYSGIDGKISGYANNRIPYTNNIKITNDSKCKF